MWRKLRKQPVSSFDPSRLRLHGRNGQTFLFTYQNVRIDATLDRQQDGDYLFLTVHGLVPDSARDELIDWLGIDTNRAFVGRCFADGSSYYCQKAA